MNNLVSGAHTGEARPELDNKARRRAGHPGRRGADPSRISALELAAFRPFRSRGLHSR